MDLTRYRCFTCKCNKVTCFTSPKHKQLISVPTDTVKTSKTGQFTPAQTVKSTLTSQPISVSQTLPNSHTKDTGASGTPPPSPPTPHRTTSTTSPQPSPSKMPSLRDRAVFFPPTTFDGKDKTKMHHTYKVLKIL